jgi:cytochrome c oxidase subunit 2
MEMGWPLLLADGEGSNNLSIFDPASPPAESIRQMSILVLAITASIFVVVEAVLFYSIFRFRRRPGEPLSGDGEPPQVYGSMPIEIAWTTAPTLIVFLLILVIGRTVWEVRRAPFEPPPEGTQPLNLTVIGHQWWWEYVLDTYEGQPLKAADGTPLITANELHVPASNLEQHKPGAQATGLIATSHQHRPVYLRLLSADVCHSYWVPRLAGKTDLIPGRDNQMWFETDRKELFLGQCAEFCGTQHAHMLLRVQVDSPEDFQAWLDNEKKDAVDDPSVRAGRDLFLSQSCVNCHRIRGTLARGTYAPDLTHLMSRQTLAAGTMPNTEDNLRRWVADPQKLKPGCLMPAFGLSGQQVDQIVRYLRTLK